MKQHITVDQLNELSEKGKEKYHLYGMKIFNYPGRVQQVVWHDIKKVPYPLLSIGQMIEFLDGVDSCNEVSISNNGGKYSDNNYQWSLYDCSDAYIKQELCDALWEAVKEVLES